MVLGWICANDFHEIITLCGNGLVIGGVKLLRGLFERAVVLQYLSAFPDEVQRFFDFNNIHLGKLYIHNANEFNLEKTLPAERINEILKAKEDSEKRFQVPACKTCGTTQSPMSWFEGGILSMAQKARKKLGLKKGEGLDSMYGICYFVPTMHTHPTFYSFKEWVEFSEHGMEWKPDAERRAVSHAMPAAHWVMLHVLISHNEYFKLGLNDELEERGKDFEASWSLRKPNDGEAK